MVKIELKQTNQQTVSNPSLIQSYISSLDHDDTPTTIFTSNNDHFLEQQETNTMMEETIRFPLLPPIFDINLNNFYINLNGGYHGNQPILHPIMGLVWV